MTEVELRRKRDALAAEVQEKSALFEERTQLLRSIRSLEALIRTLQPEIQALSAKNAIPTTPLMTEKFDKISLALTAVLRKEGAL